MGEKALDRNNTIYGGLNMRGPKGNDRLSLKNSLHERNDGEWDRRASSEEPPEYLPEQTPLRSLQMNSQKKENMIF